MSATRWPHDARIIRLQVALLDHTGHVWRGLSNDEVRLLVGEIDRLRSLLGWRSLEMTGRMRPRKYARSADLAAWEQS